MIDLHAIVDAIRRQRPGVVPEWPAYIERPYDKDTSFSKHGCRWYWMTPFPFALLHPMTEEAVEAMLVGWLAMEYATSDAHNGVGIWGRNKDGNWFAFAIDSEHETTFPPTTLGCILALCHAIGIEVPSA